MDITAAATFVTTGFTMLIWHNVADHWVQTDQQATDKGRHDHVGVLACLRHVATYTITLSIMLGVVWGLFDLAITPLGFLLGQVVSAVSHYWADRRYTLQWLATKFTWLGKKKFYHMGAPRPGKDDNPCIGTGSYALDQAWHWGWLFFAALVTSLV